MRVKRLEVQGFKSFKDKTVIHFDHSITGIVGPNGCGKSNIVDAFFWVMGEQSYKHMRGASSDDLIFNGSSKYSPLGMAEATLVLETDVVDTANAPAGATVQDIPLHLKTKEIAVTRRVYRTGEGEYFVNGVPARLKDIQELFMDTGVGAKGYSVIEQGQIGKIVNAKPEDRRLLVEEAAGIAKYKARKKESLRKMEATQGNLSRLNDVIQEIERNLNSLERQAQKARQYRKYKDELLDKEMTWGRRKSLVIRQRLEALKGEREAVEQELAGLRAELQVAENGIEIDRMAQLSETKLAEELQLRVQELSGELAREQSALDLSRRRQGDLAAQLETLQSEKQELESSIASERETLAAQESEVARESEILEEAARASAEADSRAREKRQETIQARQSLDASKRQVLAGIAHSSELTSRSAALQGRLESAAAQAEKLRAQAQAQREKTASARLELEKAQAAVAEAGREREEISAAVSAQEEEVSRLEKALASAEQAREEAERTATQLASRLQSLEELAAAFEGLGNGPKAALDWAKAAGKSERIRALADAFEVTEGYEGALESWLEDRLQSLISDDPEAAVQALAQLRESRQGRVSIHVATQGAHVTLGFAQVRSALELAGFTVLGELEQFVQASEGAGEMAREIARSMISKVVVVESMAPAANFIACGGVYKLQGWSLVGRDGTALDGVGLLRGGGAESDLASNLLGRKRAIADLRVDLQGSDEARARAGLAASEAKSAAEAARSRLAELRESRQKLEIRAAALDRDVLQNQRALRDAESQLELVELEIAEMAREEEEAAAEREQIDLQLQEASARRQALEASIAEAEAALTAQENELRELEAGLQSLRIAEAQRRERSSSLKRELEGNRGLVQSRERRLAEVTRVLERASGEREQFAGGDAARAERIESLTRALADSRSTLAEVKDRLEKSGAHINAAMSRIKGLHSGIEEKGAGANALALEAEKISGELTHLVQNLEEKYGPGCLERPSASSPIQEEMTEPVVTSEMTAEEEQLLGEEVERLRERIRRLGEVNVMAIEEFEETQKRYDHLMSEKSDLERSISNLEEAIEHINKTSEERFRKAFEAIANRFERLFPIIFGGGQAQLSLVYPEGSTDILEAGVDILAQPPGKKVSNIGLLSGGEKALTAVSLIFAIFMVKPSPFCVLDEVDAPLDDANIGKFNALLREMAAKSQFILITHNKKTMELNDTLYGVTMEEPGVSKMVSIEMQ